MVESSSTGPEIIFLMVPERFICLVVMLRFGISVEISTDLTCRLVVKALDRLEDMVAVYYLEFGRC